MTTATASAVLTSLLLVVTAVGVAPIASADITPYKLSTTTFARLADAESYSEENPYMDITAEALADGFAEVWGYTNLGITIIDHCKVYFHSRVTLYTITYKPRTGTDTREWSDSLGWSGSDTRVVTIASYGENERMSDYLGPERYHDLIELAPGVPATHTVGAEHTWNAVSVSAQVSRTYTCPTSL